jgi:hypothetical protein
MRKTAKPTQRSEHLWRCPKCRREFAHAGQWHSCDRFSEADYLKNKKPEALAIYRALAKALMACAPVAVSPTKTMVCFKLGSTVVSVRLMSRMVEGALHLGRRIDSPRFEQIVAYSSRSYGHRFRLTAPQEIDSEFKAFLEEACLHGARKHALPIASVADDNRPIGAQIAEVMRQGK